MDGNRRWAREHGVSTAEGHYEGFQTAVRLTRNARVLPVDIVTLWAFSSDNWRRSNPEVDNLMQLMTFAVEQHLPEMQETKSKFVHLGRKDRIPPELARVLTRAESETADNPGKTVVLAIDFGGEDEAKATNEGVILDAARLVRTNPRIDDQTLLRLAQPEHTIKFRAGHGEIPPADLIIRPSETRTSDVGWINGRTTELHFIPGLLFPDMTEGDLQAGIVHYIEAEQRSGV